MITSSVIVDSPEEWIRSVLAFESKIHDLEAVGQITSYDTELSITEDNQYQISIFVEMDEDYE